MPKLRILLVGMPSMLTEIIRDTITDEPDMLIMAQIGAAADLAAVLRTRRVDIVLFNATTCDLDDGQIAHILQQHPRLGLLAIEGTQDRGTLHHLIRVVQDIGTLQHSTLLAAIRSGAALRRR